ncbi:MAG: TolC family outer membrane protein [Panacagrimonas sp.]
MRLTPYAVLLACFLAPAAIPAAELLKVYEQALANDTQLQAAQHARDAAVEARPQARAALLPQILGTYARQEGSSDGTSTNNFSVPDNNPTTPDPVRRNVTPFDADTEDEALSLSLQQIVFDWSAFTRYGQAGIQVALAEARFRNAGQSLVLRTAQAYFDVLGATDNLGFSKAEKTSLDRQLEQARRRFEVGLSAITDVQEAQARFDLTVAQEIAADQQLASAHQALAEITGSADTLARPLRDEIPLTPPTPAIVETWVSVAKDNNLDLLAARLAADIADKDIDAARAGHLPTVGFQAQYQDVTSDSGDRALDSTGETYGVQVQLPIFSGLAIRSRISQATAIHEQRKAEYVGAARSVERQTRDAYLGVMSGAARVKALKQAVLSSTTALDASETGLEVGTRTAIDVLNAQRDLFSARRDYSRARYDYLLSVLQLKAAAGKLGPDDLAEIDALLIVETGIAER